MTIPDYKKLQLEHVREVNDLMRRFVSRIKRNAITHDASKFEEPELSIMAEHIDELQNSVYGSPEWESCMQKVSEAKVHHYQVNRHHPEHFDMDISQMDLLDVVEMTCDWISANRIHGSKITMKESFNICFDRFNIKSPLKDIIWNTAVRLTNMKDKNV